MATVQERLASLINAANTTTGKTDANMTAATQSLIDGFGGVGADYLQYASSLVGTFKESVFPENFEIEIDISNIAPNGKMSQCFANVSNLKIAKLASTKPYTGEAFQMFNAPKTKNTLELVDLSGITEFKPLRADSMFAVNSALVEIRGVVDLSGVRVYQGSGAAYVRDFVAGCAKLTEARFAKNGLRWTMSFSSNYSLSDATVTSIIDALVDLSAEKTETITFHSDIKAKLTPEQVSAITNKNWTLG